MYIKKFEAFFDDNDSLWEQITFDQMWEFVSDREMDEFNQEEMTRISNLLQPFGVNEFETMKYTSKFGVYRFTDDWIIFHPPDTTRIDPYICDGINGFISCIKESDWYTKCAYYINMPTYKI